MQFQLNDIGKVSEAELSLDGITIIVGNNNTGKTTISRALYAFVNSLYNIDYEVDSQRKEQAFRIVRSFFAVHRRPVSRYDFELRNMIDNFVENQNDDGFSIRTYLTNHFLPMALVTEIDKCISGLMEVRALSNKAIRNQIIENYFNTIFRRQCLSVRGEVKSGRIKATFDGHVVSMLLQKDGGASYASDINVQRRAYFVDTPDLLDFWGSIRTGAGTILSATIRNGIAERIEGDDESSSESALDDLIFAGKYDTFVKEISRIIGGRFDFDESNILKFVEPIISDGAPSAIDLNNVSEGLKAFGVLELLLRYRILREKDVLILDEPEVHLHPEWQLEYAQLIVALQKAFNLRVLITTHSSNFMLALQFYARIAGRKGVVNSYRIRPESKDSHYSVVKSEDASDWDDAYFAFVKAAQKMQDLQSQAMRESQDGGTGDVY